MIAFFDKEYGKKMIGCQGGIVLRIILIFIPNSYAPRIIFARKMGQRCLSEFTDLYLFTSPGGGNFSSHLFLNGNP
jgi:hypothetical protein